jgi:hypothetical protein
MKVQRKISWLPALLGFVVLAGCAGTQVQDSPEDIVRQRATARWQALIAGDVEKAYQFLQPAYRAVRDLKFYRGTIAGGAAQWKDVDVIGVECKADACSARIRIGYVLLGKRYSEGLATHYDEKWISEKGDWWLYERP